MYPRLRALIVALREFLISDEPARMQIAANVQRLLADALRALLNENERLTPHDGEGHDDR